MVFIPKLNGGAMNYIQFLNLVKGSVFHVCNDGIIVVVDNWNCDAEFFNYFQQMTFEGFGSLSNGHTGEKYSICFKCEGCMDRFCYKD